MPNPKPTFHVGVIITLYNDQGQILLAKRSLFKTHAPGVWENLSGAIEMGEQPVEALKRELAEEIGAKVKYQVGPVYNTFYGKLQNDRHFIGISFLCHYLSGNITLNQEHTDYQWVSLDQAIHLTTTPGLKQEFKNLKSSHHHLFSP